jgi:hypothetical protein
MPGEQLVQLRGWIIGDAAQDVGEPSLWIDTIEFCRVKRPLKEPDRVYPLAKHQEYACVYDWDDRSS